METTQRTFITTRSYLDGKDLEINDLQEKIQDLERQVCDLKSADRIDTVVDINTSEDLTQKTSDTHQPEGVDIDCLSAEINAIEKFLIYKDRPEGQHSISGRSKNQSSIYVLLETAVMEVSHPKIATTF